MVSTLFFIKFEPIAVDFPQLIPSLETPSILIDWGDGSPLTAGGTLPENLLPGVATNVEIIGDHIYTEDGVYLVTIIVEGDTRLYTTVEVVEQKFDVFLLMDASASFGGDFFGSVSDAIGDIVDGLAERFGAQVDPVTGELSLPEFLGLGVGFYNEYDTGISNAAYDRAFTLAQPVVGIEDEISDFSAIEAALDSAAAGGGDGGEALFEALYQVATGEGYDRNNNGDQNDTFDIPSYEDYLASPITNNGGSLVLPKAPESGGTPRVGGVGFRADAIPIIVVVTDEASYYEVEPTPVFIEGQETDYWCKRYADQLRPIHRSRQWSTWQRPG